MAQKHIYKPSGTTAVICYWKKRNKFLSVIMYWYNLTAVSQLTGDKKVNTVLQCYFSHSLWYMDPCQECNQQEVEETAA